MPTEPVQERLTHQQQHVLLVLSTRGASAANDWAAWFPLDGNQYDRLMRLANRGLVDRVGFDGRRDTYGLTRRGHEVVATLVDDDEDGEL